MKKIWKKFIAILICHFQNSEFHISYLKSGEVEDIVTHTVHSGTMVQAPCGYHPTVASPGSRNAYLWVLAAFRPESRRYDLAINDPVF